MRKPVWCSRRVIFGVEVQHHGRSCEIAQLDLFSFVRGERKGRRFLSFFDPITHNSTPIINNGTCFSVNRYDEYLRHPSIDSISGPSDEFHANRFTAVSIPSLRNSGNLTDLRRAVANARCVGALGCKGVVLIRAIGIGLDRAATAASAVRLNIFA